jgi:membrane-bound lytic murein transglycosylase B
MSDPLRKAVCATFFFLVFSFSCAADARSESFDSWLSHFKMRASSQGISQLTLNMAFQNVSPHPRVIELDQKQPERKKIGFATYLKNVMSQTRIDQGRSNYHAYSHLLSQTEKQYGVPASVVVSLWGVETSYGANTGGFDLIQSLATLAWEGRRREFFEKELMSALEILQGGHVSRQDFKGSWAGAMGQNQFMPSSWKSFAVDADGDGHRDIWTTKADVFASSSNYLLKNGWKSDYPWGWQVSLPASLPHGLANSDSKRPLGQWKKMGIRVQDSNKSASVNDDAVLTRLLVPDGGEGRAYLVTSNFDTILSWNRSNYFALTVGLLSDFIKKGQSGPEAHLNR